MCIRDRFGHARLCELLTSPPTPPPHVESDCFSVGVGAAFGGFIGGIVLTAALGGAVAVAVVYRAKREVTLDLRSG